MAESAEFKVKEITKGSAFGAYRALMYGQMGLGKIVWAEILYVLLGGLGGALGRFLRMKLYPTLFKSCGRKVVFGKNVTLRHPHKIVLGDGVVLDDNCVVDAKGADNSGIVLRDRVYVGRNTIVYCKNGDVEIGENVSFSANCIVFSSNKLTMKKNSVVAAFAYLLSGGEYDLDDPTPLALQKGTCTKGPLEIGEDCWIGAGAKVLDGREPGRPRRAGRGRGGDQADSRELHRRGRAGARGQDAENGGMKKHLALLAKLAVMGGLLAVLYRNVDFAEFRAALGGAAVGMDSAGLRAAAGEHGAQFLGNGPAAQGRRHRDSVAVADVQPPDRDVLQFVFAIEHRRRRLPGGGRGPARGSGGEKLRLGFRGTAHGVPGAGAVGACCFRPSAGRDCRTSASCSCR
jgi:acetyltransferase-like isoleucine patch superfamily enzyme